MQKYHAEAQEGTEAPGRRECCWHMLMYLPFVSLKNHLELLTEGRGETNLVRLMRNKRGES